MKLKVKICGMREEANIKAVAALIPDYMGFIYYENSPRYVGMDFQAPIMDENVNRVGVFVNHSLDFIFREVERNSLHAVQLHGGESPTLCATIIARGITVIKTFSISAGFDFSSAMAYQDAADFFLFDTKGKNYGGTGITFDWTILEKYSQPMPFFLSGGLSSDNVDQVSAIKNPQLYGVDLNSGVEESAGLKDIVAVKKIMNQLKESK